MNDNTLLYHQIHPDFVQFDSQSETLRATSQAFYPSQEDKAISTYDGDQISAQNSWVHYTESLNKKSRGVLAITPAECKQLGLLVTPDGKGFPEHVSIDCAF